MTQFRFWGPLVGGVALSLGCGGSTVNPVGGGPGGAAGSYPNGVGGADSSSNGPCSGGADSNSGGADSSAGGACANSGGSNPYGSGGADSNPGGADSNSGGAPFCVPGECAGGPSGGADSGPTLADVAGTWTGYVENYHFADSSDVIKLVLDGKGTGQLTVGASLAPAPPKNFDVGYPPALTPSPGPGASPQIFVGLLPGFSFTLRGVSLVASRIQFDVSGSELSATWCQHQMPYNDNQGHFTCETNGYSETLDGVCSTTDPATMKDVVTDCGKLALCGSGSPCSCTAKACAADPTMSLVHFDIRLGLLKVDSSDANGSAAGLDASVHNVYLTRGPI